MVEGSWAGSGAGSVLVTDGSRYGYGRPKPRIRIRMLIRILNTAVILPTRAPTSPKTTFEGSGGPQKKTHNWSQICMQETLKDDIIFALSSPLYHLWLEVGQSDCMIVWLRAIPTTSRPAKSARDCKSAFHTPFYHSTYIPLFLSPGSFLHISCFLLYI
jgi:hypothetical protein